MRFEMWGQFFIRALVVILFSQLSFAQQDLHQCLELARQLEQMANAQSKILYTMVKKNDSLADTLDHFADDLGGTGQKVKKSDIISIRKSAKSYRGHSARESELVDSFSQRTGLLIEKVSDCLKNNKAQPLSGPRSKVVRNSGETSN